MSTGFVKTAGNELKLQLVPTVVAESAASPNQANSAEAYRPIILLISMVFSVLQEMKAHASNCSENKASFKGPGHTAVHKVLFDI